MLVRGLLSRSGVVPQLSAAFGVSFTPGNGDGYIRIDWSVANGYGTEYITVAYNVISGNPITAIGPGFAGPAGASPFDIPVALGVNARASATISLYSVGGVLLDTVVLPSTFLPTS